MTTAVEVNGVVLRVEESSLYRNEELNIGDQVKVLSKTFDGTKVSHGTIIGFEPFKDLPTIIVAYVDLEHQTAEIKFLYYNSQTKDIELIASAFDDDVGPDLNQVLNMFDKKLKEKNREIEEIKKQREYFIEKFSRYWTDSPPIGDIGELLKRHQRSD